MLETRCDEGNRQGLVFKKALGSYVVRVEGGVVPCALSSKLRKQLVYPTADPSSRRRRVQEVRNVSVLDPVAVGDRVCFVDAGDGSGMIVGVLPRRNSFVRPAAGGRQAEQVIAANVDQLVPILAAAQPQPTWGLLDRYLAIAEANDLPVTICITKVDLLDEAALLPEVEVYRSLGYDVVLTSVRSGVGIEIFKSVLTGRLSVFVGKSGVGKTSLLNNVQPGLGLRVNEVSDSTGKGKHTTVHLEMFDLEGGGAVIDTPGVRELGIAHLQPYDLGYLFRELRPLLGRCQFGIDCSHSHEPGCAVKAAVAQGQIAERRYRSYLALEAEIGLIS